jgi:hypothetical protein
MGVGINWNPENGNQKSQLTITSGGFDDDGQRSEQEVNLFRSIWVMNAACDQRRRSKQSDAFNQTNQKAEKCIKV